MVETILILLLDTNGWLSKNKHSNSLCIHKGGGVGGGGTTTLTFYLPEFGDQTQTFLCPCDHRSKSLESVTLMSSNWRATDISCLSSIYFWFNINICIRLTDVTTIHIKWYIIFVFVGTDWDSCKCSRAFREAPIPEITQRLWRCTVNKLWMVKFKNKVQ
jgi:hypothetical protein